MNALQKQHIVDLFVWVNDALPKQLQNAAGGHPPALSVSELLIILIWGGPNEPHKTLKATCSLVCFDSRIWSLLGNYRGPILEDLYCLLHLDLYLHLAYLVDFEILPLGVSLLRFCNECRA
jgi:hypothetical protein